MNYFIDQLLSLGDILGEFIACSVFFMIVATSSKTKKMTLK